jgi:hypothetical protein
MDVEQARSEIESRRKDSGNPIDKMKALLRSIGYRVCVTIPR